MKVEINNERDSLKLIFSDNKVKESISLEIEMIADIDNDNQLVCLNVCPYSILRQWTDELLKENDLPLLQDSEIPFYMHHGYEVAFFRIEDIDKEDILCTCYVEEDNITRTTLKEFLQRDIDFIIRNRFIHRPRNL